AWTSTYSTTCSVTTSSSIGGAIAAGQSGSGTTGNTTIVPTSTGTGTYSLTCIGTAGGATVTATTPTITVNASSLSALSTKTITTIGSTIDPIEMGGNPYGLTVAPITAGLIMAGDLVVCNFNDGATNTQGLGTTIVGLHPTAGATPYRIAQDS